MSRANVRVTSASGWQASRTPQEEILCALFAETLGVASVGIGDNFFDLGGGSLLAVKLIALVEMTFGRQLSLAAILKAPTAGELGSLLSVPGSAEQVLGVIPIQGKGSRPPFFCVGAGPLFKPLALRLGLEQPFLGLGTAESDLLALPTPFRLEDLAARLVLRLRKFQPNGPYYLGGWCYDGILAYETAQQLRAQGQKVALLVLFDARNPAAARQLLVKRLRFHLLQLRTLGMKKASTYILDRWNFQRMKLGHGIWNARYRAVLCMKGKVGNNLRNSNSIESVTVQNYLPKPYSGRVLLLRSDSDDPAMGWQSLVVGELESHHVPGGHRGMFVEPNVEVSGRFLRVCLLDAQRNSDQFYSP
ncbi:MAG: thioesterase domain-containing protein [Candidatus Sulfotelmatobacter sp.]